MHPYKNEDEAFERLKDLQREVENSHVVATNMPSFGSVLRNLVARAWWLGGLAMGRPPRPRPAATRRGASAP